MESNFFTAYSSLLAYEVHDIAACKKEPIQYCGAIQNAGYFLGCSRHDLRIVAASRNFGDVNPLGQKLSNLFSLQPGPDISPGNVGALERLSGVPIVWQSPDLPEGTLASFSLWGDFLLIELECGMEEERSDQPESAIIRQVLKDLDGAASLADEHRVVAKRIKEITGFDRVMIYYFHQNWDGEVLAEDIDEGLEPFLHLRYPASDIPEQARALYLNHAFRLIVDTHADPLPIVTSSAIALQELDLSNCVLRAVSPFHIQYLRNMGVRTSFSVPLKVHGRLWGLISCHDTKHPRHLAMFVRSTADLIGRIYSGRIAEHLDVRRRDNQQLTLNFTNLLVDSLGDEKKTMASFRSHESALLKLMDAEGAFVRIRGQEAFIGSCPSREIIEKMLVKIRSTTSLGVWKSENLKAELQLDATPREAAGALAIPLSFGFEELIVWFRPESIHQVRWGGKPQAKDVRSRLEPRASFQEWVQNVENSCEGWTSENDECAQHFHFNFIRGLSSKTTALAHANRELEKIARAKDEFVGMVSHELRTPLSIIIGWVDMLREYVDQSNDDAMEAIDVIDRNARLQINLINDLLDVSRIIAGKLILDIKPGVSIDHLVRDVLTSLQLMAEEKGVVLSSRIVPAIQASADPVRFRQIVWNLVNNALKFSAPGGEVRIHLDRVGRECVLTVEDEGIGMEEHQLETIFNRFTQVSSGSKSGLGLGLSIVKSLVELHGGRVQALSAGLGKGARFVVYIPEQELVKMEQGPRPALLNERILEGRKVLLAEDDKDASRALLFLLKRLGAECVTCNNGLTAYGELLSHSFDLIISDVGMPKMNGYELLKNWRANEHTQNLQRTPAIALTALAGVEARIKALEAGFQTHLPKPIDRSELIAAVHSLDLGD